MNHKVFKKFDYESRLHEYARYRKTDMTFINELVFHLTSSIL